ncbi:MAG: hypothetical protein BroJett014_04630 [Planctomycetota bacterium]|nr:MAG: hypothetical protein BroJett014_04630 [Planctomycetota bacterium]
MVAALEQPSLRHAPTATLAELRGVVADISRNHNDIPVQAGDIEVDEETGLVAITGKRELGLRPLALSQLGSKFGVPGAYLAKCPTELRAENLNHWLRENRYRRLLLRCDGDSVRAVLSEKYAPVDHSRVLGWLSEAFGEHATLRFELTEEQLLVQFVGSEGRSFGPSDDLTPGISLRNSEVGLSCVELSGLIYRRICLNGLILAGQQGNWRRRHIGDNSFGDQVREAINNLRGAATASVNRFAGLRGIHVPDMSGLFERVAQKFELTKVQHDAIKAAFNIEPGESLFAGINAVTRAGNAESLDLDSRRQLQEVGGRMLALAEAGSRWLN